MITRSIWGAPPRPYTKLLTQLCVAQPGIRSACVVGASDGRFALPLVRRGIRVACYDVDRIALYGGEKTVPLPRERWPKVRYARSAEPRVFPEVLSRQVGIAGLAGRLRAEGLSHLADIRCVDFFRSPPRDRFDFVFTSCSMQYKLNRDLDEVAMVDALKRCVCARAVLAIEYMMPLQDNHEWKAPQFYRRGAMSELFDPGQWLIRSLREPRLPSFEAAHVDRPADHFHRIGRIVVRRRG